MDTTLGEYWPWLPLHVNVDRIANVNPKKIVMIEGT